MMENLEAILRARPESGRVYSALQGIDRIFEEAQAGKDVDLYALRFELRRLNEEFARWNEAGGVKAIHGAVIDIDNARDGSKPTTLADLPNVP